MDEDARRVNRRKFLRQSASFMAVGAAGLVLPSLHAEELKAPGDPMRVPGALPRPYGDRSPFEKQQRLGGAGPGAPHGWGANAPNNFNSLTPLQDLHGIMTPSSLHFERHHNGVPRPGPATFACRLADRLPGMFGQYLGRMAGRAGRVGPGHPWIDQQQRMDRRQTLHPSGGGRHAP
ncbi:MAG: Oxidoreductase, molybdopterin binding [Nitrospira sp.]|nr:Oxidoreductase, molybdopterin binding [Nitrospira sp.]